MWTGTGSRLVFSEGPVESSGVAKAHAAKDGDGHAETALSEIAVLALGIGQALLELRQELCLAS